MAQPTLQPHAAPARARPLKAITAGFDAGAAQAVFLALSGFPDALAEPILTAGEKERAQRLAAPQVRRGFVAGRWLLRSLLAAIADVEPRSLELRVGTHGKIFLAGHGRLAVSFNLSHSAELVAVALVRTRSIGIDVEAERPLTDAALLARRILGPRELERFETLPERARDAYLLAAWTRKEAVLKAIGIGISGGLSTIDILGDSVITAGDDSATWSVRTLSMPRGFHSAIAIEGEAPRVVTWQAVLQRERSA